MKRCSNVVSARFIKASCSYTEPTLENELFPEILREHKRIDYEAAKSNMHFAEQTFNWQNRKQRRRREAPFTMQCVNSSSARVLPEFMAWRLSHWLTLTLRSKALHATWQPVEINVPLIISAFSPHTSNTLLGTPLPGVCSALICAYYLRPSRHHGPVNHGLASPGNRFYNGGL